ncbi:MAG: DUF917 family protein [Pseudomonadota bacterium]
MGKFLSSVDAADAVRGGLLLSAGGSGTRSAQRHVTQGEHALAHGRVELVSIEELHEDDPVLTSTGVGAPGMHSAKLEPDDYVLAARAVIAATGQRPRAVMCGHAPGMSAWVVASALRIPLLDLAANGRAHPTVKLGGMGLASQPHVPIVQAACAGKPADAARLEVVATGNLEQTSRVMRHASTEAGGVVASARGMLTAGFCKAHGAAGAVSYAMRIGALIRDDVPSGLRLPRLLEFTGGEVLGTGQVVSNTVMYANGFTRGRIAIESEQGMLLLHVFNEHMAVDSGDARISTFPDLIASLTKDCEALAIHEMTVGSQAVIVRVPQARLVLGSGVRDRGAYTEIEEALGVPIAPWSLQARGSRA